ncbi:hypothetical protein AB4853_16495 [Bradyrhizobium sp. 1050_B9_N1_2]|uniref:hypothetical protein n=1 Tax=Bradyrhizobium sp. 1050_B9_N1_2 TaxID=3238688 RepID=UPI003EDBDF4D
MSEDRLAIDTKSAADAGKVSLRSLADIDGRTLAARTARALVAELESDAGGADRLSAGERALIVRAAITSAMCEDAETRWLTGHPIDVAAYAALTNNLRRLLTTVGLKRQPRNVTPDLRDYLAAHAEPADGDDSVTIEPAPRKPAKRARVSETLEPDILPCPIPPAPGDSQ